MQYDELVWHTCILIAGLLYMHCLVCATWRVGETCTDLINDINNNMQKKNNIMISVQSDDCKDSVYTDLEAKKMMQWEQKDCARRGRLYKDQLIMENCVIRKCKIHKKNLIMHGLITGRPTTWCHIHGLKRLTELSKWLTTLKKFMLDGMWKWKTGLDYGRQQLGEVHI